MTLTGFDLCRAAMAVTGITAPEQSVLLTLAVMANADAQCWPAINGAAGLTGKTKLSERSVQYATRALEAAGHITRESRPGKGMVYTVHPRTTCTPAEDAPVQDVRGAPHAPTPAPRAPKQPVSTNTSTVASQPTRSRARKAPAFVPPSDIPEAEWEAFEEMRVAIRKPLTPKSRDLAIARLRRLAEDGYPPGAVLNHSTLNNYQGLFPPKDDHNGHGNRVSARQPDLRGSRPDPALDMLRASQRAQAACGTADYRGDYLEAGPAVSALEWRG